MQIAESFCTRLEFIRLLLLCNMSHFALLKLSQFRS
jgi:hypothetical protein